MQSADDREEGDPALAGERTDLAWTRTAIAFAAVGAAITKIRPAAGIPVIVLSVVIWELGRLPRLSGAGQGEARRLLVIAVTVTAIAAAALILSFLSRGTGLVITRP